MLLHGIHLPDGRALTDHRHGEGAQVVQEHPAQFRFALPAGTLEPVVILFTAFEGAVDEHELPFLWQCPRRHSERAVGHRILGILVQPRCSPFTFGAPQAAGSS